MAYSFQNPYMSTLSNVLVIHIAQDKGETFNTTEFTIPAKGKLIIDGTLDIECNY